MKSTKTTTSPGVTSAEQWEERAISSEANIRRTVAHDPRAPNKILEKLSHDSDKSIREAVAGNPNTPAVTLSRLGAQFPDKLLGNPALDTLIVEKPDFFSAMSEETLAALAKRETCRSSILAHLARTGRGKGLLISLVQNGRTPPEAIRTLIDDDTWALGERFECPVDFIRHLRGSAVHHVAYRGEVTGEEARSALWRVVAGQLPGGAVVSDLLPSSVLPRRVKDDIIAWACLHHGRSAGRCPVSRPASVLESLACSADKRLLKSLQAEPSCPHWLRSVRDCEEAKKAIENHRAESELSWHEATASGSDAMLLLLADHPIAKDRVDVPQVLDRMVRMFCAQGWKTIDGQVQQQEVWLLTTHPCTAPQTLEFLYEFIRPSDRPALPPQFDGFQGLELQGAVGKWLKSSRCKAEQLVAVAGLFWTTDRRLRDYGSAPFKLVAELETTFHVRAALGSNPGTPRDVLRALAGYGEPAIGLNPSVDADTLRQLYSINPDSKTVLNISSNPAAPADLLREIAQLRDDSGYCARNLSRNPASPEEALLQVAGIKTSFFHWSRGDAIRDLLSHPNLTGRVLDAAIAANRFSDLAAFRSALASDTRLSPASYERLSKIPGSPETREILATNPAVSMELLYQLSMDKNTSVKKAAIHSLTQRHQKEQQ